jgi:hypothetical protein
MTKKEEMYRRIEELLHDADVIHEIITKAQKNLTDYLETKDDITKLEEVKVEINEVHARVEGMTEFVLACKTRVEESEKKEEEIDIWL